MNQIALRAVESEHFEKPDLESELVSLNLQKSKIVGTFPLHGKFIRAIHEFSQDLLHGLANSCLFKWSSLDFSSVLHCWGSTNLTFNPIWGLHRKKTTYNTAPSRASRSRKKTATHQDHPALARQSSLPWENCSAQSSARKSSAKPTPKIVSDFFSRANYRIARVRKYKLACEQSVPFFFIRFSSVGLNCWWQLLWQPRN